VCKGLHNTLRATFERRELTPRDFEAIALARFAVMALICFRIMSPTSGMIKINVGCDIVVVR